MKIKYMVGLGFAIVITLALFLAGYQSILNHDTSGARVVQTNYSLSRFSANTVDDKKFVAPKKHIIVYEAFASWCIPCRTSVPEALKFARNNKDVTLVGVAYRDVNFEIIKFEKKHGSFDSVVMGNGDVESALGLRSIPQTLFVVDGQIRYRLYGIASQKDLSNVLLLVKGKSTSSNNG